LKLGVRQVTIAGVFAAMTFVATVFTRIPIMLGYFNLGDTVVLVAAALFGGFTGAFAGAVGSAAADIVSGYYIFAPITFLIKGMEGYAAGKLSGGGLVNGGPPKNGKRRLTLALIAGAIIMVLGYFLAEATALSLFDGAFGFTTAVAELPFNVTQGGVSIILARLAIEGIIRSGVVKRLRHFD